MAGGRLQTNAYINEPVADSVLVAVKSASQRIYVQRIRYAPSACIVGTVLSFIDSLTLKSLGKMTILPPALGSGTDEYTLDYGSNGFPLSTGASLTLAVLSGGVNGSLKVSAYQLPPYVVTPYVVPATAGFTA